MGIDCRHRYSVIGVKTNFQDSMGREEARIALHVKSSDAGYVPVDILVKYKDVTGKESIKTLYPDILNYNNSMGLNKGWVQHGNAKQKLYIFLHILK